MATAFAFTPVNMDTGLIWYGNVTVATSTHIQIVNGSYVQNYFGAGFTFNSVGVTGGTLQSTNFYIGNVLQYEITGLSHSAVTFNSYLNNNDPQGLAAFTFNGHDTFVGSSGADVVNSHAGNDSIYGGGGNDVVRGNAGNDTLDGGLGTDTLFGGSENDTYIVNTPGDMVIESAGEGADTVRSSANYTLSSNVEKLLLTGSSGINGTGNNTGNTITGNGGDNRLNGGDGNDKLTGGMGADTLNGGTGNDQLNGGTGNDALSGGSGNDTLIYDASDTSVQGGSGTDTLRIDGSGVVLNLTAISNTVHTGIEVINLTGTGNNTLTVRLNDVLAISASTDTLRVNGNAGDVVKAGSGWTHGADQVIGANTYDSYTRGTATLLVDSDITQNIFA